MSSEIEGCWVVLNSSVEFTLSFRDENIQIEGRDTDDNKKIHVKDLEWDKQTLMQRQMGK